LENAGNTPAKPGQAELKTKTKENFSAQKITSCCPRFHIQRAGRGTKSNIQPKKKTLTTQGHQRSKNNLSKIFLNLKFIG